MFYRRKDAKLIKGLAMINRLIPHLLRNKIGSQVYVPLKLYMDNAIDYVKEKSEEKGRRDFSYFDILVAAVMRAIAQKPQLNRFVKGRQYYQRNDLSATFIVKKKLTEEDEERQAIVNFDPADTFDDYTAKLRKAIQDMRTLEEVETEKIMKVLFTFPSGIVNFFTGLLMRLDDFGMMPFSLSSVDGMHTSIYIANLGSIGFDDAPFHHIYEWGTGSVFLTFGRLHKERVFSKDGTERIRYVTNAAVSIDERISDGIFFANGIRLFKKYVENPWLLDEKPELPDLWEKMKEPGKTIHLKR
jgi:hypothetical protein